MKRNGELLLMETVKEYWLAGKTDETLKEIRQILQQRDGPNIPNTDTLLLFSNIYYKLGSLQQAIKLLNEVKFDTFDVSQWNVENNILVLKYLESKSIKDQKTVTLSFSLLYEKLQGLPFCDVHLLEVNVCLNYALVILCSTSQQTLVPGGYHVSQAVLQKTFHRVFANQHYDYRQRIDQGIGHKLRFYFKMKNGRERKLEELNLVTTLILLLASNFLVNFQVSNAQTLIETVVDLCQSRITPKNMDGIFTLMEDPRESQEFFLPVCHLLFCYSSFIMKTKREASKHCDQCLRLKPHFVSGLLMKGLLLYENGEYEDAIQYLQQIVMSSKDAGYKATALNLLGCICAKLGKTHTAILKFREAFVCHAGHIEALYNVAVVYNDLGELDLEISLWKYILKVVRETFVACRESMKWTGNAGDRAVADDTILSLENWHVCHTTVKISMDYICGIAAKSIGDSISEETFLLSTDIHCVQRCNFRNSKLCIPSVLFKIAHTCMKLKRYSEASEFFGQLLAQLNDKPVDLQECGIPSIPALHKEFAVALFNCDRWDHCLGVCEKILNQEAVSVTLSRSLRSQDKAESEIGKILAEIILCKAMALKELQMPVEANECYESILGAINTEDNENSTMKAHLGEPEEKKLKLELVMDRKIHRFGALIRLFSDPSQLLSRKREKHHCRSFERCTELQKLKALILSKQSLLLSCLGRKKEALLVLTQGISYEPDSLKYRYNHANLLFDIGLGDKATKDWLEFRRIHQTASSSGYNEHYKLKDLPKDDEDHDIYVEMDSRVMSRLCQKS